MFEAGICWQAQACDNLCLGTCTYGDEEDSPRHVSPSINICTPPPLHCISDLQQDPKAKITFHALLHVSSSRSDFFFQRERLRVDALISLFLHSSIWFVAPSLSFVMLMEKGYNQREFYRVIVLDIRMALCYIISKYTYCRTPTKVNSKQRLETSNRF